MLELRAVAYRYPGYSRRAVEGIDLTIRDGEVVGVVGPSDAGKSTLCLVASGLAPGSIGGELTGDVVLDGSVARARARHDLAGRVGIVFQDPGAQRTGIAVSVFEEVAVGPMNLGLPVIETVARTRRALDAVGIGALAERHPARLSGGETQLVAIASALAMMPRHLVLDEPAAELDSEGMELVTTALRAVADAGVGILVAEQRTELLASVCTRIVALDGGRIVLDSPVEVAFDDPTVERIGVRLPSATRYVVAVP